MATLAVSVYLPYPKYRNALGQPLVLPEGSVVGAGGFTAAQAAYIQAPSAWVGGTVPYAAPDPDPALDPSTFTLPRYSRTAVVNGRPVGYPSLASDPSPTPGGAKLALWAGAESAANYATNSPGVRYDTSAVPTRV